MDQSTTSAELSHATQPLAEYARQVDGRTIIVTDDGRPIVAIVALPNADAETIALGESPLLQAIIERSRQRQAREGGISSAEMRRRLGMPSA